MVHNFRFFHWKRAYRCKEGPVAIALKCTACIASCSPPAGFEFRLKMSDSSQLSRNQQLKSSVSGERGRGRVGETIVNNDIQRNSIYLSMIHWWKMRQSMILIWWWCKKWEDMKKTILWGRATQDNKCERHQIGQDYSSYWPNIYEDYQGDCVPLFNHPPTFHYVRIIFHRFKTSVFRHIQNHRYQIISPPCWFWCVFKRR